MNAIVTFTVIPLGDVVESARNPRRTYNQAALNDLAESLRAKGVITPLLVRPGDDSTYEIAAGHRRYRAAKIAGLSSVPCLVRPMSDDEFLEVLTIENDQREDVHPLEQAFGYRELLKRPGYDVAHVAEKIGRPEAFVYGRLQLCDLIPVVQGSFLRNDISIGHARLIARLDADRQEDALKACFRKDWASDRAVLEPVSSLKHWIRSDAGRDLKTAPFDRSDPELLPAAGPCTSCPRGSGVNRLLFDGDGDETCFDSRCFDRKTEAHIHASGLVAISSSFSSKGLPAGVLLQAEYEELAEPDEDFIRETKEQIAETDDEDLKRELQEELAVEQAGEAGCGFSELAIVAHGHTNTIGKEVRICRNPECPIHGRRLRPGAGEADRKEEERRAKEEEARRLKAKVEAEARRRSLAAMLDGFDWSEDCSAQLGKLVLHHLAGGYWNADKVKRIGAQFIIERRAEKFQDDLVRAAMAWPAHDRNALIVALLLDEHLERSEYNNGTDLLDLALQDCGYDLEHLRREAREALKTETKPAAKKAASRRK